MGLWAFMIEKDMSIKIIGLFSQKYFEVFSINEIAKKLDKKYPFVHNTVKKMVSDGFLNSISFGRSLLCSINLENPFVRYFLGYYHLKKSIDFDSSFNQKMKISFPKHYFVVLSGNNIFVVGSENSLLKIPKFRVFFLTENDFLNKFDDLVYSNHSVISGREAFFDFILKNKEKLTYKFHPLFRGDKK